jgi:hypothetical protein
MMSQVQTMARRPATVVDISVLFSVPSDELQGIASNCGPTASLYVLSNSLFDNHPVIRRHVVWTIESVIKEAIKNK